MSATQFIVTIYLSGTVGPCCKSLPGVPAPRHAHKVVIELREDEEAFRNNGDSSGLKLGKDDVAEKAAHYETV